MKCFAEAAKSARCPSRLGRSGTQVGSIVAEKRKLPGGMNARGRLLTGQLPPLLDGWASPAAEGLITIVRDFREVRRHIKRYGIG